MKTVINCFQTVVAKNQPRMITQISFVDEQKNIVQMQNCQLNIWEVDEQTGEETATSTTPDVVQSAADCMLFMHTLAMTVCHIIINQNINGNWQPFADFTVRFPDYSEVQTVNEYSPIINLSLT